MAQQQQSMSSPLKPPPSPYARPPGSAPEPIMVSPHPQVSPHPSQISPQHGAHKMAPMYSPNPGSVAMSPSPHMNLPFAHTMSSPMGPPSVGAPPGYPPQMAPPFSPDGRNGGVLTSLPLHDLMNGRLGM